jgi:hypothetical protein
LGIFYGYDDHDVLFSGFLHRIVRDPQGTRGGIVSLPLYPVNSLLVFEVLGATLSMDIHIKPMVSHLRSQSDLKGYFTSLLLLFFTVMGFHLKKWVLFWDWTIKTSFFKM